MSRVIDQRTATVKRLNGEAEYADDAPAPLVLPDDEQVKALNEITSAIADLTAAQRDLSEQQQRKPEVSDETKALLVSIQQLIKQLETIRQPPVRRIVFSVDSHEPGKAYQVSAELIR